jgi:hypothetical protein
MFVLVCAEGENLQRTSEEETGGTDVIFETRRRQILKHDDNDYDITESRSRVGI